MPIEKKLIVLRTSKAIIIPKSWLDFLERDGKKVTSVAIEVDGDLKISPIFEKAIA